MKSELHSIGEASKISGLGIDVFKKFIKLKAIVPIEDDYNDIRINSFGMHRMKIISELLAPFHQIKHKNRFENLL